MIKEYVNTMAHKKKNRIRCASPRRRKKHKKKHGNVVFEIVDKNITQGRLYMLAGRTDDVCTLHLREGSESYEKYGPRITVVFVYTHNERKLLENDEKGLDNEPNIKAKLLVPLSGNRGDGGSDLEREGIPVKNIESIMALHYTPPNNIYRSKEKRILNVLEVPFEASANGDDILWCYEFLCRQKKDGVGLMPEYENEYLACKYVLEKDNLTTEERGIIYNENGKVGNPDVAYHILFWRKAAGVISEKESRIFNDLKQKRNLERVEMLDKELKKIGIPFHKFCKDYPAQAQFVYTKLQTFNDRSFNTTGKFPLYMDFRSFVHIYLGHVDVMNMGSQMAKKDKFQLQEKDVLLMIDHVMHELNNDYQVYRAANPQGKFIRRGEQAYYCQGDYYEVYVDKNGRLESFYKASRLKGIKKPMECL